MAILDVGDLANRRATQAARLSAAPFVALWITWAALLAAAMLLGNLWGHASGWATAARMGSSVVLVVTAWRAFAVWSKTAVGPFALAIAIGMTLGTIGDFFNAGLLKFIVANGALGGIAAFGLGHISYIAGSISLARRARLTRRSAFLIAVIGWQIFAVVAWYAIALGGSRNAELVWPALPYSLLLAGTAGVTGGLALQERRLFPLAAGAVLFLISDFILAFELFRGSFAYQSESVWLTYGPGQMLIVFSILPAAVVLAAPPEQE